MSFSIFNLIFLSNAVFAAIYNERKFSTPVVQIFSLVSLIIYSLVYVSTPGEKTDVFWPALMVSGAFFFYQMLSAENGKKSTNTLDILLGLSPLLLMNSSGVLLSICYVFIIEAGKLLSYWDLSSKETGFLARTQASDLLKIISLILIGGLSLVGLDSFRLSDIKYVSGPLAVSISVMLFGLALLYLGVFDSLKNDIRSSKLEKSANPFFRNYIYTKFLPVFFLVITKSLLESMDFSTVTIVQKSVLWFSLWGIVLVTVKSFKALDKTVATQRIYFMLLSVLWILTEEITALGFLSLVVISEGLRQLFNNSLTKKLRHLKPALSFLMLPTPLSPLVWYVLARYIDYNGPLKSYLLGYLGFTIVSLVFLFSFKREKHSGWNLDGPLAGEAINPINSISITILTAIVSVIFVAKISL